MAMTPSELKAKIKSGEYKAPTPTLSKAEKVKQSIKSGAYTFGVDSNYIQSFIADSNKYIRELNEYQNNKSYKSIKDRYNSIDTAGGDLKSRAEKIETYAQLNGSLLEPSVRDQLQELATNVKLNIDQDKRARKSDYKIVEKYATEDDYNDALFKSKYSGATYDQMKEDSVRLQTIVDHRTPEEAATYQRQLNILNGLMYNTQYSDKKSYDKAISDIDTQISNVSEQLKNVKNSSATNFDQKNVTRTKSDKEKELEERLSYLETAKATLQANSKLAEFTEMPNKLGSDNMAVFKSNYSKYIDNPTGDELVSFFEKYDSMADGEAKEEYYRNIPEIEDPLGFYLDNKDLDGQYHQSSSIGKYIGDMMFHAKDYHWDQITEDEKLTYQYTLVREGKERALEYLSLLEPQFGQRYQAKLEGKIAELGVGAKIGLNVVSIPMKMIGGVFGAVDNISDRITEGKVNPYSQANHLRIGTNAIRSETAKGIAESSDWEIGGRNVLAEAYNIGMSTVDSIVGGKAFGTAYSVVAGLGASADAAEDIYDRGGTTDQVFWGGVAAGLAEMVFEYVSIDKLLKNSAAVDSAKAYFKNTVKQAGIEASEEVLTEMSNKVFDKMIMDEKSTYNLRVKELVDGGMSLEDAHSQALSESLYDVIWAAVGGFASGGAGAAVFGGGALYSNTKANISLGADLKKDEDRVSGLFKYAESIKDNSTIKGILKHNTADNISDKNLGRLYNALVSDIQSRFSNAKTVDEVKETFKNVVSMDRDYVLQNVAREYAADRYKEITPIGENDTSFIQEELTSSLLGRMEEAYTDLNTHQGQLLADLPQNVLVKASQIAQGGNGVKAADIGIDPQSQYYKNLESAGLADSEGVIKGEAIMAEVSRRAEVQKVGETGVSAEGEIVETFREITVNMSESERAEILRNKSITPVEVGTEYSEEFDFEDLKKNIKSKVEKALLKKFRELGFLKKYSSTAVGDIEFEFTAGGVRKSLNSQETLYGGTKADFAKAAANLQKLLDNAVLIETHTDKGKGTNKENARLKQVYVLLSVMRDGDSIIPVQFEVKQYIDNNNRLYLAVALTKIETSVVGDTASQEMRTRLLPVSDISIPDLFAKINPSDGKFLKYIPNEFLNDEQIASKRRAQKEDADKYGVSEQGGFTNAPDKDVLRERTVHDEAFDFATGVYRSPRMMQAESVAKLFGVKLWWDEKLTAPYYNFETHCIFLNPKMSISDMYTVIFKHELVHHFELKKGYDGFKNYLFKNSPAFAQYCYDSLETVNDTAFDGTYEEAIKAYTQFKYEQYKNSTEIPEGLRERFTVEMAEMEIVADFVGERLLFGKNVDKSMEALTEVAKTDRNLFQRIWDWIKDKLKALKKRGDVQDRSLTKDLEYLNDRLKRVWDSKDKKNSTANVGVKYGLNAYNQHQKDNWATSKRIVLYESDAQFKKFVEDSLSGKIADKKIYFGAVSVELADAIKRNTGINVENYNCSLSSDEILKINKDHGDQTKEEPRGQRAITIDDYLKFPQVVQNADDIVLSPKLYNGKPVILFIQNGNERTTVSAVVSDKRMDLFIQTAFINTKKGNLATPTADQATVNTPEANSGTVSNSIISTPDENVKHYLGFNKDGEVDFVAPKKPSVNDRADRLTKRFGRYETGVNGLKEDLTELLEMANDNDITGAARLAQEMSTRFKGVDGNAVNADAVLRNLNNAVISKQIEYRVYRGLRHIEKDNRSLRAKLELSDKRIAQLEGKEFDSHRYHEQMEKKRLDREDRAKNLKHFHSIYNRLNTRLEGNTDVKHIPEHLKEVVRAFLNTFKTGNVEVDGKWQRRRLTSQNLAELSKQYEFAENDSNGTPNMAYDESVKEFIDSLYDKASKSENGLLMQDLDAYDVLMLSNLSDNVMQMVRLAEETFREGKAIKFQDLSEPCIKELKACKDQKEMRNKLAGWMRNLTSGNMTPPYFFKMLGEGFYKLYNDIVEGQGKWALHFNAAKSFVEKIQQKYNYSKWNAETVVLKTERGDNIKLTIEQAMQLYATVKRQLSNRKQDAQHLNIGGIVLEDSISSSNWRKIKSDLEAINNDSKLDDDEKQSKTKRIWDAFHDKCDNAAMQLSIKDLMSVGELLNEEQKNYTEAWVNYLSNNMAALGNETSMLLFGYEKFTESNYIPYNSAENYLYSQPGAVKGNERLKHLSFTKTTQKKAATPLVLSSLSEVCAAHVDKMCMYNAMAVPLENLNKVFNCTLYDEIGTPTENIKKEIERAFGADAIDYLKQFIEDANGKVRNSSDDSIADVWISRYKKGAVLASMSVVVQQPSAMFRAMVYIPPKYFMRLKDVKGFGKNYEQCCKYAPVALIKQMGRFDTGLGVSNTKWLLGQETFMDKVDDKLSFLASKADELTWSHIWTAVKAWVADTTDLKVNSEEFLQKCGKIFTEVINLTQVYDSTLVKSQHMRSKSVYMKMLTSFMAEPTVTYNILADMCRKTLNKNTWRSGLKFSTKAGTAVLTSTLVNVLLKSLVYAMRDDDEDKTFWEKYIKEISESFKQEANPLGLIPFVRDIISLIQGYDVERADMTMFDELIAALDALDSDGKAFGEKIEAIAGSLANIFGVPVKNIVRDIKSIINLVSELFDTDQNSAVGMKYAFIEGWTGESSNASYYGRMAEAVEDGDEETYDELFDMMLENGVEENDIISGVKSAIKKSDAVKDETDNCVKKVSDNSTYKILDEEDQKKFASKIKEVLCVQILDDMIAGDDAKYDELYEAKRNSSKRYTRLKKEFLDKGVSESDIDFNLFLAEIRYLEGKGIDIHEWALAELAKSKKYADTDGSGGVSKKEKRAAIDKMDVDRSTKKGLREYYGLG